MSDLSARQRLDTPRRSRRRFRPRVDIEAVGRFSESIARFLGTGRYLAIQTVLVIVWIALNLFAVKLQWDPYPFILLNLAFSTQAAYAAPLILLAQTRQAERDKEAAERAEARHEELARRMQQRETAIERETDKLETLLEEMSARLRAGPPSA